MADRDKSNQVEREAGSNRAHPEHCRLLALQLGQLWHVVCWTRSRLASAVSTAIHLHRYSVCNHSMAPRVAQVSLIDLVQRGIPDVLSGGLSRMSMKMRRTASLQILRIREKTIPSSLPSTKKSFTPCSTSVRMLCLGASFFEGRQERRVAQRRSDDFYWGWVLKQYSSCPESSKLLAYLHERSPLTLQRDIILPTHRPHRVSRPD